ncbi:MAG: hypothetical protein LC808_06155, partial [Actinobacteria bacterium]|nr:hypothetical protein [Actinomycetota bacterium]
GGTTTGSRRRNDDRGPAGGTTTGVPQEERPRRGANHAQLALGIAHRSILGNPTGHREIALSFSEGAAIRHV